MFLTKHHGLGNDFLVVLDENHEQPVTVDAALAVRLCDRRQGVGADGLIHGRAPTEADRAAGVDVVMRLLNSDGSPAEMSGNGIRCLAQAVAMARGLRDGPITAATDAGRKQLDLVGVIEPDTMTVSVGMGAAKPGPTVPADVEATLTGRHATVDMGNPHLVVVVDDPASIDLATDGAWIEQRFAEGVNVEYVTPTADGAGLDLRVWERGAGITEACGTGACAAVHAAHGWGLVGARALVRMPGGDAEVVLEPDGEITLIGPSVHIADVVVDGGGS